MIACAGREPIPCLLIAVLLLGLGCTGRAGGDSFSPPAGVYPLDDLDGTTCDAGQWSGLEEAVAGARVVALGEASHGSGTLFEAKACVVRFLVERLDFRLLAFEGNVDPLWNADDLEGAFARASNLFATHEILSLFEWTRERDRQGSDVTIASIDVYANRATFDRVIAFLEAVDPSYASAVRNVFAAMREMDRATWQREAEGWLAVSREVLTRLEADRERYLSRGSGPGVHRAIQDARVITQHLERFVSGPRLRDRRMAENVLWLLEQHPTDRVILWAHNDHVRKTRQLAVPTAPREMGRILAERLGDDYFAIGFTFGTGAYTAASALVTRDSQVEIGTHHAPPPLEGSIEHTLRDLAWPDALIVFDALGSATVERLGLADTPQAMRSIGYVASDTAYDFYDLRAAFDALVHVRASQPSRPVTVP